MAYVYLDKLKYQKRIVEKQLERYLSIYGAVCIEGPKFCGKTLTALHFSKSGFDVGSPTNNFNNKALTNLSPFKVLEGQTPRLIVEWEEAPVLLDTIKVEIDRRMSVAQFIMTNSYIPNVIDNSEPSRVYNLKMRTMTLYETGDSTGQVSLEDICDNRISRVLTGEVDIRKIAYYIVRGGFPDNLSEPIEKVENILTNYVKDIINKDILKYDNKKYDLDKLTCALKVLAKNEGLPSNNSKILKDVKTLNNSIDKNTIASYLDVFNRAFLTDNQPAFSKEILSSHRVKRNEVKHFSDISMACALLGLSPEKLLGDIRIFARFFKSLCVHDLTVYAEANGAKVSYYNDYACNEIDAVVELINGKWCAFDIRLGTNEIDKAAEDLIKIKQDINNNGGTPPSSLCVICAMADMAYKRADGVMVVPITALKN